MEHGKANEKQEGLLCRNGPARAYKFESVFRGSRLQVCPGGTQYQNSNITAAQDPQAMKFRQVGALSSAVGELRQ